MKPNNKHTPLPQAGFTLVEIMVGLTIGMLATVVIMQVFTAFEAQKRTTTGTADAQTNGSIALYNIQRELQMAGYPLFPSGSAGVADSAIECTTLSIDGVADNTAPNRISPVTITNGAAVAGVSSASDTITIRYGNSPMGGIPTQITGPVVGASDVPVTNNFGCQYPDRTLIVNGTACALSTVASTVTGATVVKLQNTAGVAANANLSCLGTWSEVTFAVNNGNLERNGIPIVAGVVNLQAQYGISTIATSNQITLWVDASGGTWAAPTVADRNRIKAVRIAVVARNAKMEPAAVTAACSSLTIAAPTGLCAWEGSAASPAPSINLNDFDANWLSYRYRVYETIIPLRNVIWSKGTL